MSQPQTPLTYEGVLELFRQTDLRMQETDRLMRATFQETDRRMKEMAQDTDRKMQETDRRMKEMAQDTDRTMRETARKMQETDRKISALGSRIGEIVENMIGGDIVAQFRSLGYAVSAYYRNLIFGKPGTNESGEIDLILQDGDIAILIEVKTSLKTADVVEHIERLEKYRRYRDSRGVKDEYLYIGAVAGAVVEPNVVQFAQKNGLYVIVQSGKAVEIIPSPEGFVAKKW
ncbi:MAG TPA: hypothetical protein DEB39_01295 [Planctomycetaceae bacterium]|nr:hypothetical protein [Planctomycetaceae bacterium]